MWHLALEDAPQKFEVSKVVIICNNNNVCLSWNSKIFTFLKILVASVIKVLIFFFWGGGVAFGD